MIELTGQTITISSWILVAVAVGVASLLLALATLLIIRHSGNQKSRKKQANIPGSGPKQDESLKNWFFAAGISCVYIDEARTVRRPPVIQNAVEQKTANPWAQPQGHLGLKRLAHS